MKKALKIFSTAVSVIMIAALAALMCMGWLNISGKAFHIFGYALLRVQTGSMAPAYEEGDFLLAEKVDTDTLKAGDVITFYSRDPQIAGMLNTHRITAAEGPSGARVFTTKGDAAENEDAYKALEEDVFGVVRGKVGFLKSLAKVLSIPWVFGAVVFFPLILMIAVEARSVARIVRRSRIDSRLAEMGLDPENDTVSALAGKYGIEIFINAKKEIDAEKNARNKSGEE